MRAAVTEFIIITVCWIWCKQVTGEQVNIHGRTQIYKLYKHRRDNSSSVSRGIKQCVCACVCVCCMSQQSCDHTDLRRLFSSLLFSFLFLCLPSHTWTQRLWKAPTLYFHFLFCQQPIRDRAADESSVTRSSRLVLNSSRERRGSDAPYRFIMVPSVQSHLLRCLSWWVNSKQSQRYILPEEVNRCIVSDIKKVQEIKTWSWTCLCGPGVFTGFNSQSEQSCWWVISYQEQQVGVGQQQSEELRRLLLVHQGIYFNLFLQLLNSHSSAKTKYEHKPE